MKLGRWSLACYRLPCRREVRWADGVEAGGLIALLRLESSDGGPGIAEGTIEPAWSGASLLGGVAGKPLTRAARGR